MAKAHGIGTNIMKSQNSFIFILVLPNLILNNPFETKYAAIVSSNDTRVKVVKEKFKSINELLDSFVDTRLKNIESSVLLIHKLS